MTWRVDYTTEGFDKDALVPIGLPIAATWNNPDEPRDGMMCTGCDHHAGVCTWMRDHAQVIG